jgi:hypothetical protein
MKDIEFNETVTNIDCSLNYSYLLNFWHVSKLNKEFEYIKRHGLHPALVNVVKNGVNDVAVEEGNEISTYFYTVFKIFLKSLFPGTTVFKTRDTDEWKLTYSHESFHLDDEMYLLYKYFEDEFNTREGIIRKAPSRYGLKLNESFLVKLIEKDQLHAKILLDKINSMQETAQLQVEKDIEEELGLITDKIAKKLQITKPVEKKVATKATVQSQVWERVEEEVRQTTARMAEPARPVAGLNELLPIYEQIKHSITMFNQRTRFSYLLNYAKHGSTNVVINDIQDNEANYQGFMQLTNNMAA